MMMLYFEISVHADACMCCLRRGIFVVVVKERGQWVTV